MTLPAVAVLLLIFGPIAGWIIGSPSFLGYEAGDWQIQCAARIVLGSIVPVMSSALSILRRFPLDAGRCAASYAYNS